MDQATQQLLASDAVDRSVSQIDFTDLNGQKVYFDTSHIRDPKDISIGFVNSDYIISALRQQMLAAGCHLQDKIEDSKYVVEARVGALGTDGHEVIYGIPANNMLGVVTSFVPTSPAVQTPTIPEISFAKKNNQLAAAKIAVFAYNRETREAVWQSGISRAKSTTRSTWVMGAGPFQSGTIYKGTRFAGADLENPLGPKATAENAVQPAAYDKEVRFIENKPPTDILLSHNAIETDSDTRDGLFVGTLSAVDENISDHHMYNLVPDGTGHDNASFLIDGNRLLLRPGATLDPQAKSTYTVRVTVTDNVAPLTRDLLVHLQTQHTQVPGRLAPPVGAQPLPPPTATTPAPAATPAPASAPPAKP